MKVSIAMCLALACTQVWAVNKCTGPDGKVVFQDMPCASGKAEAVTIWRSGGLNPVAPAVTQLQAPKAKLEDAPAPSAPAQRTPAKSPLEQEADLCLAWYRPFLRDPQGAYHSNLRKEQRVLSLDLHATNGFGGYVVKPAACEIYNGKLNPSWTKIHAQRGGWLVE